MADDIKNIIQIVSPFVTVIIGLVVFIYRYQVKIVGDKIDKEISERKEQVSKLENDTKDKFLNSSDKFDKIFNLLSEINAKLSTISGEIKTQREICDERHQNSFIKK